MEEKGHIELILNSKPKNGRYKLRQLYAVWEVKSIDKYYYFEYKNNANTFCNNLCLLHVPCSSPRYVHYNGQHLEDSSFRDGGQ